MPENNSELEEDRFKEITHLKEIIKLDQDIFEEIYLDRNNARIKHIPHLEFVGGGSESFLVVDPTNNERVLGFGHWNKGVVHGVLPFSATFNLHAVAEILYPENFPHISKVEGLGARGTTRQRIYGRRSTYPESIKLQEMRDKLEDMGINIWMDTYGENFMTEKSGSVKFVDLISGSADGIQKLDLKKVKQFFINKYHLSEEDLIYNDNWKRLSGHLRRLKELLIVDIIFDEMSHTKVYDLSNPNFKSAIDNFDFQGNTMENERSRINIIRLLKRATKATLEGHEFKDNRWVK
ncbi:MAG: hypothetical protein UW42_C0053G0004 [Candidatus Collierbacteria bacterium GW2011_GWB1_44_197]|nr:MAG: hypothetical protein UW42_C0053G0004 [Candidatus Collierbacteria bacterium GW2011_GWB1_44_197]